MNILFLQSSVSNYVVDALFFGLRQIKEVRVVDVPRIDAMYKDASPELLKKTGNRGASIYGLLDDDDPVVREMRYSWTLELARYDLIVLADVYRDCEMYFEYIKDDLLRKKTVIIDGNDVPAIFPFSDMRRKLNTKPYLFFYNFTQIKYFKREFESNAALYGLNKMHWLDFIFSKPKNLLPITMSIPKLYIKENQWANKSQELVKYNVDADLTEIFGTVTAIGEWKPTYNSTEEYFTDLDVSRFGITTKRQGWDCLRHYEYAARGVVLCFKNLNDKPPFCAPFDLNESNAVIYSQSKDLLHQLNTITEERYIELQSNSYKWVEKYTSENVAAKFLNDVFS